MICLVASGKYIWFRVEAIRAITLYIIISLRFQNSNTFSCVSLRINLQYSYFHHNSWYLTHHNLKTSLFLSEDSFAIIEVINEAPIEE